MTVAGTSWRCRGDPDHDRQMPADGAAGGQSAAGQGSSH